MTQAAETSGELLPTAQQAALGATRPVVSCRTPWLTRRQAIAGLTCFGLAAPAGAQPAAPDLAAQLFSDGLYLPRYLAGPDAPGLPFAQYAAFLGDERTALAGQLFPRDDSARLGPHATAEDALQVIARQAGGHRVVILNEAHVCSRHRHFLGEVARVLRPLGFDHLAMETLKNDGAARDGGAAYRKYLSARPEAGTYSWDPVLAETMRQAASLGYRFLAYEQRAEQKPADPPAPAAAIAAAKTLRRRTCSPP